MEIEKKKRIRISTNRIAILGLFLAVMFALKWGLGFIPGLEVVSFFFIIFSLFLPLLDLAILVVCFNMLVAIVYGIGSWWVAYWFIWPIDVLVTYMLKKVTNNKYIFAGWGLFAGLSVAFWYFLSGLVFFGKAKAIGDLITALPVNLIEGLATMFAVVLIGPKMLSIVKQFNSRFWPNQKVFMFSETRHKKWNIALSVALSLGSLSGISLIFANRSFFNDWKENYAKQQWKNQTIFKDKFKDPTTGGEYQFLNKSQYDSLSSSLSNNQVGLALIANHKVFIEEITLHPNWDSSKEKIEQVLNDSKLFEFKFYKSPTGEDFIQTFKERSNPSAGWQHGTATYKNYGNFYPLLAINHHISELGSSDWSVSPKEIYELSYDAS